MSSKGNTPARRCIRHLMLISSTVACTFMMCNTAIYGETVVEGSTEKNVPQVTITTGTTIQLTQAVTTTTNTTQITTTSTLATTLQTSTQENTTSLTSTSNSTSTILPETIYETMDCIETVDGVTATCDESYSNVEYIGGDGCYPDGYVFHSGYVKGSGDYILLCNCVGAEAGSDWIDESEKACVAEVILNRVSSYLYPETIFDVISQPGQFQGSSNYLYLGEYSYQVTSSVIRAVDMYLEDGYVNNNHGYTSFYGDGKNNYFS